VLGQVVVCGFLHLLRIQSENLVGGAGNPVKKDTFDQRHLGIPAVVVFPGEKPDPPAEVPGSGGGSVLPFRRIWTMLECPCQR
jgi:hypothetical protein